LHSFILALVINVAADLILIPLYKNEGAAAGFLLSCLAQNLFFIKKNTVPLFKPKQFVYKATAVLFKP
jgi:hypothetical protein